jgi:hypothetical protein
MSCRTRDMTVTFTHPFYLSAVGEALPPGAYRVVIDEDELGNMSLLAYRRIATMLHTPAIGTGGRSGQVFVVDPEELDRALGQDGEKTAPSSPYPSR